MVGWAPIWSSSSKLIARITPGIIWCSSPNTDEDHIHLFVSIPPKYAVSTVVQYMKGWSAHAMRRKFPFLKLPEYRMASFWSDGYFVSTVGIEEETIRRYIEHQGKEDHGQAKLVL